MVRIALHLWVEFNKRQPYKEMNKQEVKDRKYKTCTIDAGLNGLFHAKVAYSETSKAWEPTQVLYNGEWITIDEFDDTTEGGSYSCIDFKI